MDREGFWWLHVFGLRNLLLAETLNPYLEVHGYTLRTLGDLWVEFQLTRLLKSLRLKVGFGVPTIEFTCFTPSTGLREVEE